jgi:endonuclease/exonuclease/phosphatase family metal-dependent hydrolase
MDPAPISRSRACWLAVGALLLGTVLGAGVLRVSGGLDDGQAAQLAEGEPTTPPRVPGTPTSFTVSSLNVLGAGHTGKNGRKKGWASGPQRMEWLTTQIRQRGVDVIGLQEFEAPQYRVFRSELGSTFGTFPGTAWGSKAMRNSVAWRLDSWELVSSSWLKIPYFHGILRRMPVVLLRNLDTGQQAYFSSFHNPANARGPAERWRDKATSLEIGMVNKHRADTGLPVYVTGDMNKRNEYFCKMTKSTDMLAANGGSNDSRGCRVPRTTGIDWIFGSPETTFTSYAANRTRAIRRATDHPMLTVEAELPALPYCPEPPPTETPAPKGSATRS